MKVCNRKPTGPAEGPAPAFKETCPVSRPHRRHLSTMSSTGSRTISYNIIFLFESAPILKRCTTADMKTKRSKKNINYLSDICGGREARRHLLRLLGPGGGGAAGPGLRPGQPGNHQVRGHQRRGLPDQGWDRQHTVRSEPHEPGPQHGGQSRHSAGSVSRSEKDHLKT